MNVDATEADLYATAEALKFAAILDDNAPRSDKARIAAWAEQIHRHNLLREDLLDGLQAFYDSPHDRAIGIGDLVHHARHAKRTRLEKEEDTERDRRRAEYDAKADPDDMRALTADAISGRTRNRTPRLIAAEHALQDCHGKRQCAEAIREYFAAKTEARKPTAKAAS